MIPLPEACTCGRAWVHCHLCGGRSIYCLSKESEGYTAHALKEKKIEPGQQVKLYRCKIDGHVSNYPFGKCQAASADDLSRLNRMYKGTVEYEQPAPKQVPSIESTEPQTPMTLADLINRKEPSPEDGRE
jgi:hypothetical protein